MQRERREDYLKSIDFRKLREPEEVEQRLKEYFRIGISTVAEVQAFLKVNRLACSELWKFSERNVGGGFFRERMTEAFDSFIRCHVRNVAWSNAHQEPSRQWPWQRIWKYIL